MRVLAVCESPPTDDPVHGNGSTMIPEAVLPRLPPGTTVDLVHVVDRPAGPSARVLARCDRVVPLERRSPRAELAALPFTSLPRGSWQRTPRGAREQVRDLARDADVVYVHGLHAFSLVDLVDRPVVANAIDPWSVYWAERGAQHRSPARRAYDRVQSRRAAALEGRMAARAHTYVVVNGADATLLSHRLGRHVDVVPNGVARPAPVVTDVERDGRLVVFAGTLDYPPNVAAARTLVREIVPAVRRRVPDARFVLAGRRPTPEVLAMAGEGVSVLGDVPDMGEVLAGAAVAAFPGTVGRGTKNSVLEAMAAGCAVVASPSSARGVDPGEHLVVAPSSERMADAVVDLLLEPARRDAVGVAAVARSQSLPTWDDAAARYAALLAAAATLDAPAGASA